MAAKIVTMLLAVLLISGGSLSIVQAHHTQDMQGMKDMSTMKSEEPIITLKIDPAHILVGKPEAITISINDPAGKPERELTMMHDRTMHVVIASQDFTVFSHIHPEDFGSITAEMKKLAQYPMRYSFSKSGRYIVGIDFAVNNQAYSRHFVIDVAGEPEMGVPFNDFSRQKKFGDYEVVLTTVPESITAGKEMTLVYQFNKDGVPVTNLEPYIAAIMHVAVISTDLKQFVHEHGYVPGMPIMEMQGHHMMHNMSLPSSFGPEIKVPVVFPAAGVYTIFGEVKHKGKVIVTHFMLEVR